MTATQELHRTIRALAAGNQPDAAGAYRAINHAIKGGYIRGKPGKYHLTGNGKKLAAKLKAEAKPAEEPAPETEAFKVVQPAD